MTDDIKDPILKEMVESGAMDETQLPFDESENEFDESEQDSKKIELPHTLKLSQAVLFGNKKIEEITFKNYLKAGDIMHLPLDNKLIKIGHFVPIVSQMTGETQELIKMIAQKDFIECMTVVNSFLSE